MAGIFDAFPEVAAPPSAPTKVASSIWDAYPEAPQPAQRSAPRPASGLLESAQAGHYRSKNPILATR